MEQGTLLEAESAEVVEARRKAKREERLARSKIEPPRLVTANRSQIELRPSDLESLIPASHRARAVWAIVEKLDLNRFYEPIRSRGSEAGRPSTDPKIMVALWLYATINRVGSARELDRLCTEHRAYIWIRGGVAVNYHTLSDFRVEHGKALDDLLTQLLAVMADQGLISLGGRVAQDGTRVRASAGAGSLRRRERLEEFVKVARERVQALKKQGSEEVDPQRSARKKAAQERAARERLARVEKALEELARIEQQRKEMTGGHKPKGEPRASTTDPEVRKMKMADGGFRPAFNVQLSTQTESGVIVGADITEDGTDYAHCAPMLDQILNRTGQRPEAVLVDGGYVSKGSVDEIADAHVTMYGPLPERSANPDPLAIKPTDSAAMRRLKERMASERGKEIYKERAATAELVNADLKTWRTLDRFGVRGKRKAMCVVLWNVLAYNMLRYFALAPSG